MKKNFNILKSTLLPISFFTMLVAAMSGTAIAQKRLPVIFNGKEYTDSATMVVGRYLDILNYPALRSDSTLHITCIITKRSAPSDTLYMHHWHAAPEYDMSEVVHNGTRLLGFYKDGYGTYERYDKDEGRWTSIGETDYSKLASPFDYHASLYEWESRGITLRYDGEWDYKGHAVYRVYAQSKTRYDRYYLFEKESGLLFFVDELETRNGEKPKEEADDCVDWRAFEEYQPLGNCIMPSVEIYQQKGDITRIVRRFEYLPMDLKRFKDVNIR